MRILIVTPCNPGAKYGNYYLGKNWISVRDTLRQIKPLFLNKHREALEWKLGAIESMMATYNPRGKGRELGAILIEDEMWVIKGYDLYPSWSLFRKGNYRRVFTLSNYLQIALKRVTRMSFDAIYFMINVTAYKLALFHAINKLNLWDDVAIIDMPCTVGWFTHNLKLLKKLVMNKERCGVFISSKAISELMKEFERLSIVPRELRYWEKVTYVARVISVD